jgi:phosphoglycolate phosphatase-like HAD superfamily hydrolase
MVGDKRIDANAARHHGIFSIGAGYGYCLPGEREFFDKVVFSPKELLEFVLKG